MMEGSVSRLRLPCTHQTSRTQTFDNHAYEGHSLRRGFLCKRGYREDRLHQSQRLHKSLRCGGRNYRSSGDAGRLGSNRCGFLNVLKAFCSTGRPDHGVPCAVRHLDVRAGERQDNRSNHSRRTPSKTFYVSHTNAAAGGKKPRQPRRDKYQFQVWNSVANIKNIFAPAVTGMHHHHHHHHIFNINASILLYLYLLSSFMPQYTDVWRLSQT